MGRNLEKDAIEMASKNQRILENGFRIFAERSIEKVTMTDVANAAGIGIASLYRYYSTKPKLVVGISAWLWDEYLRNHMRKPGEAQGTDRTAAEEFEFYLNSFLDLYSNHKDILRFNQFFNIYIQSEDIPPDQMKSLMNVVQVLKARFGEIYRKGQRDGTLRTDMPEEEMFSVTLHLMLAVVTRYAVGLFYNQGTDAEEELRLQKAMLMQRFCPGKQSKGQPPD